MPHKGCPNDCVFCNQKQITAKLEPVTGEQVDETIKEYLKTLPENSYIEAAFFGGSFTGIPIKEQDELLTVAKKYKDLGKISGIRLSTRPDYINEEILDLLKEKGVTTIELGVQSLDEEVLLLSNRGHTREEVYNAVKLIKSYGFNLGLQMMTGLPSDTFEKSVKTMEEFIALKPDFVRIYPTLVIKDTKLSDLYYSGAYIPQSIDDAVGLCKHLKREFLKSGIKVIRVSLQPTEEISPDASVVAGPFHFAFGELVDNAIYYDEILEKVKNLSNCTVKIGVNPSCISKAVGNKRKNAIKLKNDKNIRLKVVGIDIEDGKAELIGVE